MAQRLDKWALVSGDWLLDDAGERYAEAYRVVLGDGWSGGESPRATRSVAEAIVARQAAVLEQGGATQALAWDGDALIVTYIEETDLDPERIESDADGLYDVSFGWSWMAVHADECSGRTVELSDVDALELICRAEEQLAEDTIDQAEYDAVNTLAAEILGADLLERLAADALMFHTSSRDFGDYARKGRAEVAALLDRLRGHCPDCVATAAKGACPACGAAAGEPHACTLAERATAAR